MKTNVNMVRKLGKFEIFQRTKDGFFNATDLLAKWNKEFPDNQRRLDKFWETTNLENLMKEILIHEPNLIDWSKEVFSKYLVDEGNFKYPKIGDLKEGVKTNELSVGSDLQKLNNIDLAEKFSFDELKSLVCQTSRGKYNGGTWLHPVMFVKFAMYLDSRFEYTVLRFVADQMIHFRKESGDAFKNMCSAIAKISPTDFLSEDIKRIAIGINYVVFKVHYKYSKETLTRNQFGEEEKQKELQALQNKIADLINDGFLEDVCSVIGYLRKLYKKKYHAL